MARVLIEEGDGENDDGRESGLAILRSIAPLYGPAAEYLVGLGRDATREAGH